LRRFGLAETQTTGTIAAGANSLTVASPFNFVVGDTVIVEIGTEAGAGARGTKGVGGTWPALSYANGAAMDADTARPANTYAWEEDTGNVRRFVGGAWITDPAANYYTAKAVPKALVATIAAVSGFTLTLNATAAVDATDANVYRDNLPAFNAAMAAGGDLIEMEVPAGSFAVSNGPYLNVKPGWTLRGAGRDVSTLFTPNGVSAQALVQVGASNGAVVEGLHLRGNARNTGFGLGPLVTETSVPQGPAYGYGIFFTGQTGGTARNCRITDVFQLGVGVSFATDIWAYDCECIVTDPLRVYIQWMYLWADATNGGCVDCSVDSAWLTAGWSGAKSSGFQLIRPTGTNAVAEMNSCGGWLIEDADLLIEANSQFDAAFSASVALININTNLTGGDATPGGTISNATMLQEGYVNASNDTLRGIVINANNPNVTVQGGIYTSPDYAAPSTLFGAWGLDSTGLNTNVDSFTVVGAAKPTIPNISVADGSVTDCTADVIDGP
jgi:hypothetical protein